jgi:hypothetical protein
MRFQKLYLHISCCLLLLAAACKHEEEVDYDANNCKRLPAFIQSLGYDQRKSLFTTSDKKRMGLLLMESERPNDPDFPPAKIYQHPSWKTGGWLGPILIDNEGNIFTSPAPLVNVWDNPVANQNTIYKVNAGNGVMEEFMRLPIKDSSVQNAYGIMAMAYLCETNTLYVSTVSGSDRQHERGAVYAIDTKEKKIIDKLTATDAMGMGITYITGRRELFFGTGRNADVNSIVLDKNGKFSGKPTFAFTLNGLGPRGDDKVRRINTDRSGNLNIIGMEFNYNLIAPSEKQDALYKAEYLFDEKKWVVK